MSRRALITGITGQDGSYLAELLLERGQDHVGRLDEELERQGSRGRDVASAIRGAVGEQSVLTGARS